MLEGEKVWGASNIEVGKICPTWLEWGLPKIGVTRVTPGTPGSGIPAYDTVRS